MCALLSHNHLVHCSFLTIWQQTCSILYDGCLRIWFSPDSLGAWMPQLLSCQSSLCHCIKKMQPAGVPVRYRKITVLSLFLNWHVFLVICNLIVVFFCNLAFYHISKISEKLRICLPKAHTLPHVNIIWIKTNFMFVFVSHKVTKYWWVT